MDGIRVAPSASIGDDEGSYISLTELPKATIPMRAPRSFTANVGPTTSASRLKSLNSVPMFHDNDLITITSVTELRGHVIEGPAAAGSLLSERRCDACVAMYHDQGHIPIKILIRCDRAAFSIGAGALFASVGHGSAPDITGRAFADPRPIVCTLKLITGALTLQLEAPVA